MTVLDRVPTDRIAERAEEIHLGRALLTLFVGVFWLVGWTGRKALLGLGYVAGAVQVGWADAGAPRPAQGRR